MAGVNCDYVDPETQGKYKDSGELDFEENIMLLAMETNTGINKYEKCGFGELMEYIKTYNRIIQKRQENKKQ